ncbi:hypothetical protein UFOVP155_54 [uncultured Caudovirales phage]|uniref:Uncharacterized protein n=1 Tax=uncultured Caudovirales phage TaxID=2100421 RepID=A0A6J7WA18_9CAUD|nr:hypothetical protein UFOVP155_54 [uncultured Caudovirales phage]
MARQAGGKRQAVGMVLEAAPGDLYEAIHCALRPYERAENAVRLKWGSVARLVSLVPIDLAARYGAALDRMLSAVRRNETGAIVERVSSVVRGLAALDKAASDAEALPPGYVGVSNGRVDYIVALDRLDLPAIERLCPGFVVVSLQELLEARAIVLTDRDRMAVESIKSATGGQVVEIRGRASLNDNLPF